MTHHSELVQDTATLEKVISIQDLLADCDDLDGFNAKPLEAVADFLYSDAAVVFSLEADQAESYSLTTRGALDLNLDHLRRYLDGIHHHDPILHATQSVSREPAGKKYSLLRLSDFGPTQFIKTKYYREFFRDTGIDDILAFALTTQERPGCPVVVAFHRSGGKRKFGGELMERGRLIAPILSSCMSRLMMSERLQLLSAATENYCERAISDRSVYVFDKDLNCGLTIGKTKVDPQVLQETIRETCEALSASDRASASVFADFDTADAKGSTTLDIERSVSGFGEHFLVSMTPTAVHDPVEIAAGVWALTEREADVVREVYAGMRNAVIAETLGIRLKTVENHISSIFVKAGVHSRTELISRIATRRFDDPTARDEASGADPDFDI